MLSSSLAGDPGAKIRVRGEEGKRTQQGDQLPQGLGSRFRSRACTKRYGLADRVIRPVRGDLNTGTVGKTDDPVNPAALSASP
jgi:hypothetical protein